MSPTHISSTPQQPAQQQQTAVDTGNGIVFLLEVVGVLGLFAAGGLIVFGFGIAANRSESAGEVMIGSGFGVFVSSLLFLGFAQVIENLRKIHIAVREGKGR
jgi:hypothetical protein